MLNKTCQQKNNDGFSILEITIVISIFTIIALIFSGFIFNVFRASKFENEQYRAIEDARTSIEVVKKELRGAIQSEQGSYNLQLIEDQDLIYYSDVDGDTEAEKVRYYRDDTLLVREITEPGASDLYDGPVSSSTIAQYINNQEEDIFVYYDGTGTTTDIINEVRMVNINLRINVTPDIAPNDYYLISNVMLRNLKDNL